MVRAADRRPPDCRRSFEDLIDAQRPTAELVELCVAGGHAADELTGLSRLELVQRVFVGMLTGEDEEEEEEDDDDIEP